MLNISPQEATEHLKTQVENHPRADDLAEYYNELFPGAPVGEERARQDPQRLADAIVERIQRGLEIEEIVDLWNVVFPEDRNVHFDEEEGTLHFERDFEPSHDPE